MQKSLRSSSGFTLVEMVIAMTIFAVMSAAILSIYLQTTAMSYRLKATRYLSETAREITERIAEDVRERGIMKKVVDPLNFYPPWNAFDYAGSGTEMMVVGRGTDQKIYVYGRRSGANIVGCTLPEKTDPKEHCGLFLANATDTSVNTVTFDSSNAYNLVDTFIPDDIKKRVKIDDLKFYISGDGEKTEHKVTLVFTLALMPRIGVPGLAPEESKFHLQTTITARSFKKN